MVQTRAQAKTMRSLKKSVRRVYRRRVKNSTCRNKSASVCGSTSGCKMTRGRKRKYCRKSRNRRASLSMKRK